MFYQESVKLQADFPSKQADITAIDALLCDNQGECLVLHNCAFLLELPEETLERLLDRYAEVGVVEKEKRGNCRLCNEVIEAVSQQDWYCDICGISYTEFEIESTEVYRVIKTAAVPASALDDHSSKASISTIESGGNIVTAELIKFGKTRPWSLLDQDEYLIPVKTFGNAEHESVLKMIESRGFCLLRFEGTGASVEILQAIESFLGHARTSQNDYSGKIKEIEPNIRETIEATTGDSAQALAFHSDGTQDTPLPPAILVFQYITSPTYGGLSTFLDLTKVVHDMSDHERFKVLTDLACSDTAVSEKKGLRYEGPLVKPVCADQALSIRFRYEDSKLVKEPVLKVAEPYRESFELLNQRINERSEWLTFAPKEGDIAIFDNWRVLHGRESVQNTRHPRYHNRMWIDSLHTRHAGKYLLGVRGLAPELIVKIKENNQRR